MRIVLASGTPYLPQVRGGVEVNTHEIAHELIARGHHVSVLTRLSYRDRFGLRTRLRQGLAAGSRDDALGYPVHRGRRPAALLPGLARPDVVVIQNGDPWPVATACARRGIPCLIYLHGLGFDAWPRQDRARGAARIPASAYLSISDFVRRRFAARHGIDTGVIPPVHRPERYQVPRDPRRDPRQDPRQDPRYVTFVNPVAVKGVELALALAALCPEIPFRLVKGWPLGLRERRRLAARIARLPNVTLTEGGDMRAVYGATRVLLVPSQWEAETWGRVATEAQYSGIPVLASDRGGLPEAVGPGGTILPATAPPEVWAEALRRLWHDEAAYAAASRAALEHAARPEIDLRRQVARLEEVLVAVAHARPRPEAAASGDPGRATATSDNLVGTAQMY